MNGRHDEEAIERELRARLGLDAPSSVVIELFGKREEHNHVRGCAIRAGSHAFACSCRELVIADIEARENEKRTGSRGHVALSANAVEGIRQTIRDLEGRLGRICDRVDTEIGSSFAQDEHGRGLWLARGEISQAATQLARHNAFNARMKLLVATMRMDQFEALERERAEQDALGRFRRERA